MRKFITLVGLHDEIYLIDPETIVGITDTRTSKVERGKHTILHIAKDGVSYSSEVKEEVDEVTALMNEAIGLKVL